MDCPALSNQIQIWKLKCASPPGMKSGLLPNPPRRSRDALKKIRPDCRVVVAVNGSTDRTAERARKVNGISVLTIPTRGKGAAVVAAARASFADIFGFIDADLSTPPSSIRELFCSFKTMLATSLSALGS